MFARVSTYRAEAGADGDAADKILEGFRSVAGPLEQIDGFSHAYFLVERGGGKAMSITIWQSQEALDASAAKADELRRTGSQTGGASIEAVESYEIGLTVGTPTTGAAR
jgi:heme-degrading monooxygenase HmoA